MLPLVHAARNEGYRSQRQFTTSQTHFRDNKQEIRQHCVFNTLLCSTHLILDWCQLLQCCLVAVNCHCNLRSWTQILQETSTQIVKHSAIVCVESVPHSRNVFVAAESWLLQEESWLCVKQAEPCKQREHRMQLWQNCMLYKTTMVAITEGLGHPSNQALWCSLVTDGQYTACHCTQWQLSPLR